MAGGCLHGLNMQQSLGRVLVATPRVQWVRLPQAAHKQERHGGGKQRGGVRFPKADGSTPDALG